MSKFNIELNKQLENINILYEQGVEYTGVNYHTLIKLQGLELIFYFNEEADMINIEYSFEANGVTW